MKAFLNWSGGKDSAYCLYRSRAQGLTPQGLVTCLSSEGRVTMHGVPLSLVERQAASIQLPLYPIHLPAEAGMASYEKAMHNANAEMRAEGFTHVMSGDLFLEDLKRYRQNLYRPDGLAPLFPIWGVESWSLLKDFLQLGFKAIVVAVQEDRLDKSFCGRLIDDSFISDLPGDVDPCGENGEYHSFVFDGPVFSKPVEFRKGEVVRRVYPAPKGADDCYAEARGEVGFHFCELLP